MMSDYRLVRVKREWIPDWLWRAFCVGNLAMFFPWNVLLTRKPADEESA
jgi:hypothetical protein